MEKVGEEGRDGIFGACEEGRWNGSCKNEFANITREVNEWV